jgi:hypothetical protein
MGRADVPPVQARAIVRAIEIEITGAKDVLATKHHLALLRGDFRAEIYASASSVARQMYAALLAQMAVLARGRVYLRVAPLFLIPASTRRGDPSGH